MWHRPFPWLDTTKLFLGEGQAILVDRVSKGKVRSKREEERLFHLHYGGFAAVGLSGGPSKGLFGVKGTQPAPDSDLKTPESGRPRNNSGQGSLTFWYAMKTLATSRQSANSSPKPFAPRPIPAEPRRNAMHTKEFLQWTFHGYSTLPKVLIASIIHSHQKSSPLSARRCVWNRGPVCSTSAAVRARCCVPGHAITESAAPVST